MWIFGYGSLIWRPDFPYIRRTPGHVAGWTRRFYQGSPDHRGTPEAPGRVVTLLADPDARTWGMAYEIAPDTAAAITARLDHREQGGYLREQLTVHAPALNAPISALTYIATPQNPSYLGPATPAEIARHVATARGPSGHNAAYVRALHDALHTLGVHDPHVEAIITALDLLDHNTP